MPESFGMRLFLAFLLMSPFAACRPTPTAIKAAEYQPQAGDFLFQSLPRNALINTIEGSTGSPFSHCGIVLRGEGGWKVIEAIGPVRETPLPLWIAQGRDNAYVAYRLREPLHTQVPAIIAAAQRYTGRPYDIHYDLDDAKIYCSELLWKATRDATRVQLGRLEKLGDLQWQPYEKTIREIEGGALPLQREMITPRALTEDPKLVEVFRFRM